MKWRRDLPDDWDEARGSPPVDGETVNPLLLGVGVDDLVVDLGALR